MLKKLTLLLALLIAPAAYAQNVSPGIGAISGSDLRPGFSSRAAGCSQAQTFLARTTALNATHQSGYTTFICGLVTDGLYSAFTGLYVFGTQDTPTASLNLISGSSTAVTTSGGPVFTADKGYDLRSTRTLSFGLNGLNLSQNSVALGGWLSSSGTNNGVTVGGTNVAGSLSTVPAVGGRIFDLTGTTQAGGSTGGLFANNRSGAATTEQYFNGSALGLGGVGISSSQNPTLGALGAGGSDSRLAFAFMTNRSLTAPEHLVLYGRVSTLLTLFGAN